MTLNQMIRKTTDFSIGLVFVLLLIIVAFISAAAGALTAALVLIAGWLVLCYIYSLYAVLSENAQTSSELLKEQKKTNYLLEKLAERE